MSTNTPTGFSDDEVTQAVEGIVLSSIRRPYDTLGVRRTDVTFTDTQEAAAGVFMLYRDAPFYILSLACARALEAVVNEAQIVGSLLDAVSAIGRYVLPIQDLSALANARSALIELESAVGQRSQAFKNIEKVPAYVRYQNNVDSFLSSAGGNVKDGGQVVMTPQEARSLIPNLVSQLNGAHSSLISSVSIIGGGIADFSSLNLPGLVASGVISKSRQILSDRLDQLQAETPEQRLEDIRGVVLDLLAQKGVIKQFGSFTGPSSSFSITGNQMAYADATHLAIPAVSTATLPGPYPIRTGRNILDFFLDAPFSPKFNSVFIVSITAGTNIFEALFTHVGDFTAFFIAIGDVIYVKSGPNSGSRWVVTNVTPTVLTAVSDFAAVLPDGFPQIDIWPKPPVSVSVANGLVAKIESIQAEPYNIDAVIPTNIFQFFVNTSTIHAVLPASPTQTAHAIVTAINGAMGPAPARAETYFSPLKYDSVVSITALGGLSYRFTLLAGQLDGLGIVVGDKVRIMTGPDGLAATSSGIRLIITAVGPGPSIQYVEADAPFVPLTDPGTRQQIQIGAPNQRIRLIGSFVEGTTIAIDSSPFNSAGITLGFFPGASSTSRATRTKRFVDDFNQKTQAVVASSVLTPDFTGNIRTDAVFPTRAVLYKFSGTGAVVAAGTSVTITVSTGGLLAAGLLVGDAVVLRSGPSPNLYFVITTITDTFLIANGPLAATSSTGVSIEVGLGATLVPAAGRTVRISTGPNSGDYEVASQGPTPIEFTLTTLFPLYKDPVTAQNVVMQGTLGIESAVFSSKDTTLATRVRVMGSAADMFYPGGAGPDVRGQTTWSKFPSIPLGLQPGDLIEAYIFSYNTPTATATITSVEPDTKIVGYTPSSMIFDGAIAFSDSIPPPFLRLRAGHVLNADGLSSSIGRWAAAPVNQPAYFIDLNRFINPLLANQNPTAVEVNDAKNKILDLVQLLTIDGANLRSADTTLTVESILEGFTVTPIPAVDVLLQSFREKGADRALDILLDANFSGFFGLGMNTSSYAGTMLGATRAVGRLDLPVRKTNRQDATSSRALGQATSPDYEYSSGDIEKDVQVNPPAGG